MAIGDILLTHAHDDHTGSASALAERTGARILGPSADAPVIEGVRAAPPPKLRDWEVPLYEQPTELAGVFQLRQTKAWQQGARV